ncbi:MAG: hypothetical protein ACLR1K_02285, partial [Oscillospiraceae bacterium]
VLRSVTYFKVKQTTTNKQNRQHLKIAFVAYVCVVGSVGSGTLMWNISDYPQRYDGHPQPGGPAAPCPARSFRLTREYFDKK